MKTITKFMWVLLVALMLAGCASSTPKPDFTQAGFGLYTTPEKAGEQTTPDYIVTGTEAGISSSIHNSTDKNVTYLILVVPKQGDEVIELYYTQIITSSLTTTNMNSGIVVADDSAQNQNQETVAEFFSRVAKEYEPPFPLGFILVVGLIILYNIRYTYPFVLALTKDHMLVFEFKDILTKNNIRPDKVTLRVRIGPPLLPDALRRFLAISGNPYDEIRKLLEPILRQHMSELFSVVDAIEAQTAANVFVALMRKDTELARFIRTNHLGNLDCRFLSVVSLQVDLPDAYEQTLNEVELARQRATAESILNVSRATSLGKAYKQFAEASGLDPAFITTIGAFGLSLLGTGGFFGSSGLKLAPQVASALGVSTTGGDEENDLDDEDEE